MNFYFFQTVERHVLEAELEVIRVSENNDTVILLDSGLEDYTVQLISTLAALTTLTADSN